MKFSAGDWPKIRDSLFAALLMAAVGALLLATSLNMSQTARQADASAAAQGREVDARLQQVRDEEQEIRQQAGRFRDLQSRGIIGEEERLDWLELIKDIRERRRLLALHYEIAAPRTLDRNAGAGLNFYASAMKIQLQLLHEADLLRFLGDLRQEAKALIQVRSCKLSRRPQTDTEHPPGLAQLQADCEIDWITASERKEARP